MPAFVSPKHFSGAGRVHETGPKGLAAIVRGVSIDLARVAATAVPAITDSSGGGAADGKVDAIGLATKAVLGTTDAAQAAATIAALGTVTNALGELVAQANAIAAKVPVGTLSNSMGGAAPSGTIAAITTALTGVGASTANAAKVNAALSVMTDRVSTVVTFVNRLCVATGIAPMVDNSGGTPERGLPGAAVALAAMPQIAAITASSGADTSDANAVVKVADMNLRLVALAASVKEVATKLNAMVSNSAGYLVVNTVAVA
ncbi:hypothetical protein [Roseococcus pinisoli]|uniref:Uncharacterized protein n=1 Tax=Roseococcus pinisoli TaxID=2835040 RepID=A0ABS5QGA2_9PROT|nr:hypothetical protein [Roseococcus pinisoli]MBS7812351.1 hypothetical protein [Roseococcus pinisoli]